MELTFLKLSVPELEWKELRAEKKRQKLERSWLRWTGVIAVLELRYQSLVPSVPDAPAALWRSLSRLHSIPSLDTHPRKTQTQPSLARKPRQKRDFRRKPRTPPLFSILGMYAYFTKIPLPFFPPPGTLIAFYITSIYGPLFAIASPRLVKRSIFSRSQSNLANVLAGGDGRIAPPVDRHYRLSCYQFARRLS